MTLIHPKRGVLPALADYLVPALARVADPTGFWAATVCV